MAAHRPIRQNEASDEALPPPQLVEDAAGGGNARCVEQLSRQEALNQLLHQISEAERLRCGA
eukprot:scaffold313046_cov37-Tisochrysis_lutea.AAC.4